MMPGLPGMYVRRLRLVQMSEQTGYKQSAIAVALMFIPKMASAAK